MDHNEISDPSLFSYNTGSEPISDIDYVPSDENVFDEFLDEIPGEFKTEYPGEFVEQYTSGYLEYPGEFEEPGEEFSGEQEPVHIAKFKFEASGEGGEGSEDREVIFIPKALALTEEEKMKVEGHWGFLEFDVVFYARGNFQYKWLKLGDPIFTVEYANKLYFFLSEANRQTFMKRPNDFINTPLPLKIPPKVKPIHPKMLPAAGYLLSSGIAQEFTKVLTTLAEKKPRFPFTSLRRSGLMYTAYYLKSMDMTSSPELRKHYLKAMAHMVQTQKLAEKLCIEINKFHGREDTMPQDMKTQMETFLKLSKLPDKIKFVDPYIQGLEFNYQAALLSTSQEEESETTARAPKKKITATGEEVDGEEAEEAVNLETEFYGEWDEPIMGNAKRANLEIAGEDSEPIVLTISAKEKYPNIDFENYTPPPYAGKYRLY